MKAFKNLLANLEDGKYTSREIVLTGIVLFLVGLVIGLFASPHKEQYFGSFNGNGNAGNIEKNGSIGHNDDDECVEE